MRLLFTTLFLAFNLIACQQDSAGSQTDLCQSDQTTTYSIPCNWNITLIMPECFKLSVLQGIDTYVGTLTNPEVDLEITYDIGGLAGFYVPENSPTKTVSHSINQEFWYETKDGMLFFTFPDAGPANFFVKENPYTDELVAIMKTLKTN